ncbi:MAG: ATP-binding protein [Leptospiraceae bacterium]|nr:ATP-binding protein [Leptospiraceae bacterium]
MKNNFTVDARTILHLGRDSIKDHNTAIIELVKNSYDADASIVEIEINSVDKNGFIRISDNGIGMTKKEVEDNWLTIGYSEKRENNKKISITKRRKTGEKGIGRISADRLGSILRLKTLSENKEKTGLEVNWDLFDKAKTEIQDIKLKELNESELIIQLPQKKDKTGTELEILNLRHSWQDEDIKKLRQLLSLFISPFEKEKFIINLKNNINENYNGIINNQFNQFKPEIDLELEYDGESESIIYSISDIYSKKVSEDTPKWRDLISYVKDPYKFEPKEKLNCGNVKIRLLVFPKIKSVFEINNISSSELKDFLELHAGVKLYRDNIHVKSSVKNEDWLGLGERHDKNPAGLGRSDYTVVPTMLVGAVFISLDKNKNITDSSSREGLIENQAYYDLRALTLAAVKLIESYRHQLYLRQNDNKKKSSALVINELKKELENLKGQIKTLLKNSEIKNETKETLIKLDDSSSQVAISIDELLDKQRVLSGLATLGISNAVFGHEIEGSISHLKVSTSTAIEALNLPKPKIDMAMEELVKIKKSTENISKWGKFAIKRTKFEKRKRSKKKINLIIQEIINELSTSFDSSNITIKKNIREIETKIYPMDLESIFINLITNAYSFVIESSRKERVIFIELKPFKKDKIDGFSLTVADSGIGIPKENLEIIWEPFFTTKVDKDGKDIGTGLGLSIVKSIVEDLDGQIEVNNDPELKGANFTIWIPEV